MINVPLWHAVTVWPCAAQMSSLDLNEEKEKEMVDVVFSNAVDSLAEEDRKLPQVRRGTQPQGVVYIFSRLHGYPFFSVPGR